MRCHSPLDGLGKTKQRFGFLCRSSGLGAGGNSPGAVVAKNNKRMAAGSPETPPNGDKRSWRRKGAPDDASVVLHFLWQPLNNPLGGSRTRLTRPPVGRCRCRAGSNAAPEALGVGLSTETSPRGARSYFADRRCFALEARHRKEQAYLRGRKLCRDSTPKPLTDA